MINYVCYDPGSGEIMHTGSCPEGMETVMPGLSFLDTGATYATQDCYFVLNGELQQYTAPQAALKATYPSYPSSWSNTSFSWVDQRTTAQLQAAQRAAIDASYRTVVTADIAFTTAGGVTKMFQADPTSQTVLMQAVIGYNMAGSTPAGFCWKSSDNVMVPFTLADLQGMYAAMLTRGNTAFIERANLKAQINAATTPAAVQATNWN